MINIEKAKNAFKEYVKGYDINNPKIKGMLILGRGLKMFLSML